MAIESLSLHTVRCTVLMIFGAAASPDMVTVCGTSMKHIFFTKHSMYYIFFTLYTDLPLQTVKVAACPDMVTLVTVVHRKKHGSRLLKLVKESFDIHT